MRQLSPIDRLLAGIEDTLRTLSPGAAQAQRPSPADGHSDTGPEDEHARRHSAGLMRINHTGEVCAQALYQAQALTARTAEVREAMARSAREEIDHLAWCEQRLAALDSRPSLLNPLFYGLSFGVGALAGAVGDRLSLGFVAATEDQVCKHLRAHLDTLPIEDTASRAVLEQMLEDEAAHASKALAAGGFPFPETVKTGMSLLSKVMTASTYRV